ERTVARGKWRRRFCFRPRSPAGDIGSKRRYDGFVKVRYFWPLVGFVVPTLLIAFGYVIPRSCIAGINELTLGFLSSVIGASVTYWIGVRTVVRDRESPPEPLARSL